MIKEYTIKNINLKGTERNLLIEISGKILKVLYKPIEGLGDINLQILTKETEEVLNTPVGGLYYPRVNISQQKDEVSTLDFPGEQMDYYYFNTLLVSISSQTELNEPVIEQITIIYDE